VSKRLQSSTRADKAHSARGGVAADRRFVILSSEGWSCSPVFFPPRGARLPHKHTAYGVAPPRGFRGESISCARDTTHRSTEEVYDDTLRPVLMAFQNPESGIFGPDSGIFSGHWSPDFGSHVTFQLAFPDSTASWPNGFQKLESGKVMTPKSKAES